MSENYSLQTKKIIKFLSKKKNRGQYILIFDVAKHLKIDEDAVLDILNENNKYFDLMEDPDYVNGSDGIYIFAGPVKTDKIKLSSKGLAYANELKMQQSSSFKDKFWYPIFMRIVFLVLGIVFGLLIPYIPVFFNELINIFK